MNQIDLEQRFGPYRAPNENQKRKFEILQKKFLEIATCINSFCPHSEEKVQSLILLQSAKMLGNASIALYGANKNGND